MTDPSSRPRILVLEDEYLIAEFLQDSLERAGAAVIGPIPSVPDALDLLARNDIAIDLALVDVNLHGERAFPVAEVLRERRIPFVFMTGYSEAAIPPRYRDVPRLEKPVDSEEVLRVAGLCRPPDPLPR
jgi:DNA-binding response OmpR family regulator